MGDSYRDELKKNKAKEYPFGCAPRCRTNRFQDRQKSKAIAWQQGRKAFHYPKAEQRGDQLKWHDFG